MIKVENEDFECRGHLNECLQELGVAIDGLMEEYNKACPNGKAFEEYVAFSIIMAGVGKVPKNAEMYKQLDMVILPATKSIREIIKTAREYANERIREFEKQK